jgi:hypothetical protein
MLASAVAMYLLTRIGLSTGYTTHVLPSMILLGIGLGLVFAPGFSLATYGVDAKDSGVASATVNTMQQVGGSVGTALLNTIAASAASSYAVSQLSSAPGRAGAQLVQANAAIHSFTTAFWWASAVFVVGAVLSAIVLRSGVPQPDPEAAGGVVL